MKRVYFIKPVGMAGPIKIGCSNSPTTRLESLATWSPFALELITEIGGGFDLERRFHALFVEHHQRREWFNGHADIYAVIYQIKAGTFDIETLPAPRGIATWLEGRKREWTDEKRLQQSISMRVAIAQRKSGLRCHVDCYGVVRRGDALGISAIEAFIADPTKYGIESWADRSNRLAAENNAELSA